MKIKLPFTEKFLWDLYNFKDKTRNLINKIIPEKRGLLFSNFNIFRDEWENSKNNYKKKKKNRNYFNKLIYDLKQRGYLKTLKVKDNSAIMITLKGREKVFIIKNKLIDKKLRKDRKWQMVLFDIPENKRRNRDCFRNGLRCLGYKMLQKSIWVCQYDTLKETKELIERYNLKLWVEILLVNKISLD